MEGIARFLAKIQSVIKLFVKMANRRCTLSVANTGFMIHDGVGSYM